MSSLVLLAALGPLSLAFQTPRNPLAQRTAPLMSSAAAAVEGSDNSLFLPAARDAKYSSNTAQYLLDLDSEAATFDFCGGMLFQLVLTDRLKSHLQSVALEKDGDDQPVIHPASQPLMNRIPDYRKSSFADNKTIFHGRELRKIPNANGGMGFVLQLSYADEADVEELGQQSAGKGADGSWSGEAVDPQGWSAQEIATYDGWRGDSFRQWRNAKMYKDEGWDCVAEMNSEEMFGLNHRFYLHYDDRDRMWLSAEDGCEGTPSEGSGGLLGMLGGMLFGR